MNNIKISKLLSMSMKELDEYIDNNTSYLEERRIMDKEISVDFENKSMEDLVKEFGLISIDELRTNISKKLNRELCYFTNDTSNCIDNLFYYPS